jgi:hypothetical protein
MMKFLLVAFMLALSSQSMAGGLVNKSTSANATEINSLGTGDTKFIITDAQLTGKGDIEKLAANAGVGTQGSDQVIERSTYGGCSAGCSSGCSVGCSMNCSMGCR